MKTGAKAKLQGFTFVELVIAVLFLGLCLGPFLAYLSQVGRQQQGLGLWARERSWGRHQEQGLIQGLDTEKVKLFDGAANPGVPGQGRAALERVPCQAGALTLTLLRARVPAPDAAAPGALGGWALRSGAAWETPAAPSLDYGVSEVEAPRFEPEAGALLLPEILENVGTEGQRRLSLAAVSPQNLRVQLRVPEASIAAHGRAAGHLSALALVTGSPVQAWCEYEGDLARGDWSESLEDGRVRWYVREGADMRVYEPSRVVSASYLLQLGAPVLQNGELLHESGTLVAFTRDDLRFVDSGARPLRVTWPTMLEKQLGSEAWLLLGGFDCLWNGETLSEGSQLRVLCVESALPRWGDSNTLLARPLTPVGCRAENGLWTFAKRTLVLREPELLPAFSALGDVIEMGSLGFAPGADEQGRRLGRVRARGGVLLSTGENLTLEVLP